MGTEGIYIGTDGIRCGQNFTVNSKGELTASSLQVTVKSVNYYQASNSATQCPTVPTSTTLNG